MGVYAKQEKIGLSPLARGTQLHQLAILVFNRFIPAGAGNTKRMYPQKKLLSVYPRWRGEHYSSIELHPQFAGLSPLARGTRKARVMPELLERFIPAGAGNTVLPVR